MNAKVQRPSVCNAVETVLVLRQAAPRLVPLVASALQSEGVAIHGDDMVAGLVSNVIPRQMRTGRPSISASTSP